MSIRKVAEVVLPAGYALWLVFVVAMAFRIMGAGGLYMTKGEILVEFFPEHVIGFLWLAALGVLTALAQRERDTQ